MCMHVREILGCALGSNFGLVSAVYPPLVSLTK